VESWLSSEEKTVVKNVIFSEIVRKNPEIPVLNDYRIKAEKSFWEKFPSKNLPSKPTTKINIVKLEEKIIESKAKLNNSSWNRAQKCLNYLKYGGPSFQSSYLPSCTVRNSTAAFENGKEITDSICTWVKKGYVSGPFSSPLLKDFRTNSILAVPQPGKIRICMNISLPEGASFNDNIAKYKLEKMRMSSAKSFEFSILEARKNSVMSKFDFVDAYKNIPATLADLRLQGFT
jgi:hypothetical protein